MSQQTTSNTSKLDLQHVNTGNRTASPAELELACINLISQLEMQIENAKTRSNHIEKAGDNADTILNVLLHCCEEYLSGDQFQSAIEAIEKASYASLAHREVLNTRPWGFAIKNLLGNAAANDPSVQQTYQQLGNALSVACNSVLNVFSELAGADCGRTIQQSAAVFVEELNANW